MGEKDEQERRKLEKQWCKNVNSDGRKCSLYLNHYGSHTENHAHSRWDSE